LTRLQVVNVDKRVVLEDEEHFLGTVSQSIRFGDTFFFLDGTALCIWSYNFETGDFSSFSGKGPGPGELRPFLTSFYPSEGTLHVANANGSRLEVFDRDTPLIKSRSTKASGTTFFTENNLSIIRGKDGFELLKDKETMARADSFDYATYGFGIHCARYEDYVLVGSKTAKNNTAPYIIFDLDKLKIHSRDTLQKHFLVTEETTSDYMKNMLKEAGIAFEKFNFQTIGSITTHKELGFLLFEFDFSIEKSEAYGHFSVIHALQPRTSTHAKILLYHGDIKGITFAVPLEGREKWLAFDSSEDELLFLTVTPL
jgi:hypothetical protein